MTDGPDETVPGEIPAPLRPFTLPEVAPPPRVPVTTLPSDALTDADGAGGSHRKKKAKGRGEGRSFARELPILIAIALALALILRVVAVQAFYIPSGSMEKTLHGCTGCSGDRVLINKLGYKFHSIHRGDIVVFNGKHTNFPQETVIPPAKNGVESAVRSVQRFFGFGSLGERDYIKRVIAVGGDTIKCCSDGHVVVNGRVLNETYLYEDNQLAFCQAIGPAASTTVPANGAVCQASDAKPFTVPKGYLFVMGDHRGNSADSRYSGVIPKSAVIGRAFILIWPLSRLDRFGTPPDFS